MAIAWVTDADFVINPQRDAEQECGGQRKGTMPTCPHLQLLSAFRGGAALLDGPTTLRINVSEY